MKSDLQFMIVDDDKSNNFLCECAIRIAFPGSTVKLFENPEDALAAIKNKYESADSKRVTLFLDINMPGLTGWEFLENFAKFPSQLKSQFDIYMLSSSIAKSDIDRTNESIGVSGFISKPLIVRELRLLLERGS